MTDQHELREVNGATCAAIPGLPAPMRMASANKKPGVGLRRPAAVHVKAAMLPQAQKAG
jgi:hypothetical protein